MRSAWGWLAVVTLVACGSEAGAPPEAPPADAPAASPGAQTEAPPPAAAEAPPPAPSPRLGAPYPIVLLHGMAGFGTLDVGPIDITYFKGVVEDLAKHGEAVYVTLAPPYASSEVRAKAIAAQIDDILARTGKAKVNLVGHSQGGLDARVLASPAGLGYGDRIASVTTIATPHRGTRVADASLGLLQFLPASEVDEIANSLLSIVQKTAYELQTDPDFRAQVTQLTEKHMKEVFNPKYVDDPRVEYTSYAGRTNLRTGIGTCDGGKYKNDPTDLDLPQGTLGATALFLEEGKLKINDGLVTVESAKWGEFQQCVPADHLKEVGQLGPAAASFDHLQLFRDIVARTRAAGL